ncbi:MAG: septal ring lytic transglycosylase RlpA family protein [Desulfovibrio sp.]|nr:septal ring lytic transglycosylase RlpA family protein [Desulfovibrio sp.]
MLQAKRIRERFYSDRTHPKRYRESNRSLSDRSFRLSERKRLTLLRKNRLAASEKKHALASYYRKHRLQRIDPQSVKVSNVPFHASSKQWVEELAGKASWYGHDFHGGPTASGLRYDMYTFTAAHRTLPIGTIVKVTAQEDGKSVMVCVTDRGPYVAGRIIDLSYAAATQLGLRKKGVGDVNLEIVCDADGKPLKKQHAFYVQYTAAKGAAKAGPYKAFSDACTMQEALRQAHPDATVILSKTK